MSVKDYIEKMKTRPEAEKKRAVFMWTTIIVILIFLIWVISLSFSVVNDEVDLAELRAEAEATAKAQMIEAQNSLAPTNNSVFVRLGRFISDGASAVSEGFWVIGSWLH